MTLKQYIIAGVIEQAIVLGFILPTTGWWFSFFALTAVWNLVAGGINAIANAATTIYENPGDFGIA